MSSRNDHRSAAARTSRTLTGALLALALVGSAACDSLLSVENPSSVTDESLGDPSLAPALAAAAIQTLQCGAQNFAATGGMLSGEYLSANGFVNNHVWEWRAIGEIKGEPGGCGFGRNTTSMGFYTPLQQARFQLEDAFARIDAFSDDEVPNRARTLTEMRAYAGYAYLLLGEGMCEMTVDRGPRMTREETVAIAEQKFSDAITRATALNDASLLNMARVGRARARLFLKKLPDAAADAILVPAGFVRTIEFTEGGDARRENRIYNLNNRNDFLSVADAYRNLTVNGAPDLRVRVVDGGRAGADGITRVWRQQKFVATLGGTPIPLASYAEAQLIYAEAVGATQAGLDAVNRVRALSTTAPATMPAASEWTSFVLEERRRQLFSEGQRYVDMLRHSLPFPTGVNRKGQVYSNLTCVPLPDVETRNNPNFAG
jgi:starch-binding outer membrane protein, SusD/RagB family